MFWFIISICLNIGLFAFAIYCYPRVRNNSIQFASLLRDVMLRLKHIDPSHGFAHAINVMDQSAEAIKSHDGVLSADERLAILLAAVLHDTDDHKFFPESKDYDFAKNTMHHYFPHLEVLVISMIKLVSCSSNGNRIDEKLPRWYYIPRWADRLEAMGNEGISRCLEYNTSIGRSEFMPETPRANSIEELYAICTPARFEHYQLVKQSISMIDHMYDKLMHLSIETGNEYIDDMMFIRQNELETYLLKFGYTNPKI